MLHNLEIQVIKKWDPLQNRRSHLHQTYEIYAQYKGQKKIVITPQII
jgi:hypothetical protein